MSWQEKFTAGSRFDSHGQFTLDESRAKEKMARFQLSSPTEFLMLVVQSAVLSGCQVIEIAQEGCDLRLVAKGVDLDPEAVQDRASYIFGADVEALPYQLLGVASNAVEPQCQRAPLVEVVESELIFEVLLKAPLGALLDLLAQRLAYLPCPWSFNNEAQTTSEIPETVELRLEQDVSRIVFVKFGVTVHEESPQLALNFEAVVAADALSMDASYAQVVKDKRFEAVMTILSEQANSLLAQLVEEGVTEESRSLWLDYLVRGLPAPAGRALQAAALFPLADRPGEISLSEVKEWVARQGQIYVARRRFQLALDTPCLLLSDPQVRKVVQTMVRPSALQDAEGQIQRQTMINARRKSWKSSPRPVELPPWETLCSAKVKGQGWKAAIGVCADQRGPCRAEILYQGRLLCSSVLVDVPPGAVAVIDVTEGKVADDWLGLVEERQKQVLKEVQGELRKLWRAQPSFAPEQLSPEGVQALLSELVGLRPSTAAMATPLFPTVDGSGTLSLQELEPLEEVRVGEKVELSERVAHALGSGPLLLFSQPRLAALQARLGRHRVVDVREQQRRLAALDTAWSRPQRPTLPDPNFLTKADFEFEGSRGEIAVYPGTGDGTRVELWWKGARITSLKRADSKLLNAKVWVDAAGLELTETLSNFVTNLAYRQTMAALGQAVRDLERAAFFNVALPVSLRLRLLSIYDYSVAEREQTPLIPAPNGELYWTLEELRKELQQHGHLVFGGWGHEVSGRKVVCDPEDRKEIRRAIDGLLSAVTWVSAKEQLKQKRQQEEFLARPVARQVALKGRYSVRTPLSEGRGEVALAPLNAPDRGRLVAYVQGRRVGGVDGVLTRDFVGAMEHPDLVLTADFDDVEVRAKAREVLKMACDSAMLQAAKLSGEDRFRAWRYFTTKQPSESAKQAFLDALTLPSLDGRTLSYQELLQSSIQGYVRPEFFYEGRTGGLVLRLSTELAQLATKLLGRQLSLLEGFLTREMRRRQALSHLPQTVPEDLFQRSFESGEGRAQLGMCTSGLMVGLNFEGETVGLLRQLRLPVRGVVWGAERAAFKEDEVPEASLPSALKRHLEEWAETLCLEWVQGLSKRAMSASDRQLALALLRSLIKEVTHQDDRASAVAASLLWDLPLFRRVDRTLVSGSALAATLAETGQPLLIASSRFRAPGEVLYLPDDAPERAVLAGFFGRKGLRDFQAPPLLDGAEIARTARSLLSWGLTPVMVGWKAWNNTMDYLSELGKKEEPDAKTRDPREVLLASLREDIRSLVGRHQYQTSDGLFQNLDFGRWPLGPPLYRPRNSSQYRLNSLHPAIRWLLARDASEADRRAVRMLLVIHWVGLVNEASEELRDSHEEAFLQLLAQRMTQTFSPDSEEDEPPSPERPTARRRARRKGRSIKSPFG